MKQSDWEQDRHLQVDLRDKEQDPKVLITKLLKERSVLRDKLNKIYLALTTNPNNLTITDIQEISRPDELKRKDNI